MCSTHTNTNHSELYIHTKWPNKASNNRATKFEICCSDICDSSCLKVLNDKESYYYL